jgi:hypothetical protein
MKIDKLGRYRFTKDMTLRGSFSIGTHPKGQVVTITQIDTRNNNIYSPSFPDWQYNDLPLEPVDVQS